MPQIAQQIPARERQAKWVESDLLLLLDDGQFGMFAIYDKDVLENLTADQKKALKTAIGAELKQRG